MAVKKKEKVSLEEILKARGSADFSVKEFAEKSSKIASTETSAFTDKLSDKEVVAFFTPFGYINHEKVKDSANSSFYHVNCENFEVLFNDFDAVVTCFPQYATFTSDFDYAKFARYCESIDTTPEQAIADLITADLFTPRFPSYAEKRRLHKSNQLNDAFYGLPAAMQKLLHSVNSKTRVDIKTMENKGKYGVFDEILYYGGVTGDNTFGDDNK